MEYLPHLPQAPPLAPAVEVLFHLSGYLPGHRRERMIPSGRMHLVIELDGRPRQVYDNHSGEVLQTLRSAWLSGVHSRYLTIGDTDDESRLVAVQFAVGGSVPFTHRSAADFVDRVVPAEEVFGSGVLHLRQELLELGDAEERLGRVERWLVERFEEGFATVDYVQSVVEEMLADPGTVRLTETVDRDGRVSYRHFSDRFRRQVGTSPKSLQRILRFSRIFEQVQGAQTVDWAGLSQELGFSDQAHLIREFREFSGYRPGEFQDLDSDRLNFFPED